MADIRVQVPDEFMSALKSKTHRKTNPEIVQDALTILNWALSESAKGRYIVSTDEDGVDVARLAMPTLDVAQAIARNNSHNSLTSLEAEAATVGQAIKRGAPAY